jgi:hypothetical protein
VLLIKNKLYTATEEEDIVPEAKTRNNEQSGLEENVD